MRELKHEEVKEVGGGAIHILGFAAAMASHHMARSAATYAISRTGTLASTYGLAERFGNHGN